MNTLTVSQALYVVADILFGIAGLGSPLIPNAGWWGLFFAMLGFLLTGYHR